MILEQQKINFKNPISLTVHSNFKILTLKEKVEWLNYYNRLPISMQDVYYAPEYYEIYENHFDGEAKCFIYDDGKNLALYPFLINKINDLGYDLDDDYFDIRGAYGYNGVVYSSDDQNFRKKFYEETIW